MDGDMMVIPAERDQVLAVGLASERPWWGVVDFEPVTAGAASNGASPVPVEDESSKSAGNGPRPAPQVERLAVLGDTYDLDDPVAQDLFEHPGPEPGPGQNRHPGFSVAGGRGAGVDGDRHFHRRAFIRCTGVVEGVLADGDQGQARRSATANLVSAGISSSAR